MSKSTKARRFVIRPDAFNPGYFEVYDLTEHRTVTTIRGLSEANRRARHLNVNPPKPSAPAGYIDAVCIGCQVAIFIEAGTTPLCPKCAEFMDQVGEESNEAARDGMELTHETWLDVPTPEEREAIEAQISQMEAASREPDEPHYIRVPVYCFD